MAVLVVWLRRPANVGGDHKTGSDGPRHGRCRHSDGPSYTSAAWHRRSDQPQSGRYSEQEGLQPL